MCDGGDGSCDSVVHGMGKLINLEVIAVSSTPGVTREVLGTAMSAMAPELKSRAATHRRDADEESPPQPGENSRRVLGALGPCLILT